MRLPSICLLAILPGGLVLGSNEARQHGSPEGLGVYSKAGLHVDSRPIASQMCDLEQAALLFGPHLTHLQNEF